MSEFKVWGLTSQGNLAEHVVSASNMEEARSLSMSQGLDVLSIEPIGRKVRLFQTQAKFDLSLFTYELETLLRAGLSLIETLETLRDRQRDSGQSFYVLSELIRQMKEGHAFSSALKKYPDVFPSLFVASISASEHTGEMVDALQRYIRYDEQISLLRQKIKSALIYPTLLLSVGFAVSLFLLCYLVPRFSHVYEGMDTQLPLASRLLMEWGVFVNAHFSIAMFIIFACLALFIFFIRQPYFIAAIQRHAQRNRWIGQQYKLMQLTRFYRSLGLLLSGGIPIVKALQMTQGLLTQSLSHQLNQVVIDIREGKALTKSLSHAGLTTPVAIRLLGAGERNGQLAEMLEQIAIFHDKEIATWIDRLTRLFEPILMLVIGLVIGGIVVLLYMPIFELAGSIG